MDDLTHRQLAFLILEICQTYKNGHVNKFEIIGKPGYPGGIGRRLDRELSAQERVLVGRAFDALVQAELLQPDYADLIHPENWFVLTPLGVKALARKALDDLDVALIGISPKLVELRDGMWSAFASTRPNALQQAAHSARELIDQTLKTGAPDAQDRRSRARQLLQLKAGVDSKKEKTLIEATIGLVPSLVDRLLAEAHSRTELESLRIKDLLNLTEIALRRLLLG